MNPDHRANAEQEGGASSIARKRPVFWRSSLYEEPVWASLAWIVGPLLMAGSAIYFFVR